MELRQLRQFAILARTLNFRQAAERMNMAQPPLSVSIAKLEAELGIQLFERHQRGVRLTPAGEAALPLADEALARAEDIRDAVGAIAVGRRGHLRIGFVSSASYSLAPRLTAMFRERYPSVELILEEVRGTEVLARMEAMTLDLGIVRTPLAETTALTLAPLETSCAVLAVAKNHPLSEARTVRLESLSSERFILYDKSVSGMRALVLLSCQNAGFVPAVSHTAAQINTVLALVEMGLGIAIVPEIPGASLGQHKRIPLTCRGEPIKVGLTLVRRSTERSRLIMNFWDAAISTAAAPAASKAAASESKKDRAVRREHA